MHDEAISQLDGPQLGLSSRLRSQHQGLPCQLRGLLGAQASGDCSPSLPPAATQELLSGAQALTQHTALDHFKAGVSDDTATENRHIDQGVQTLS